MSEFDFSSVYSNETTKTLMRDSLKEVVATARQNGLSDYIIANQLLHEAVSQVYARDFRQSQMWLNDAIEALTQLREKAQITAEDILSSIADRNLNARPDPYKTRK